jgi:ABC-type transport system involved in cytochrome bd biosynthesis fused ATPase/permease subunit
VADNGVVNGSKAPWWVQIIQTVGPTAAIALFLVYFLAEQVAPTLDSIKSYMAEHIDQMQTVTTEIKQEADAQEKQEETQEKQWADLRNLSAQEHTDREKALALAQQECINVAKSPFQVQKCLDARNSSETADQ